MWTGDNQERKSSFISEEEKGQEGEDEQPIVRREKKFYGSELKSPISDALLVTPQTKNAADLYSAQDAVIAMTREVRVQAEEQETAN